MVRSARRKVGRAGCRGHRAREAIRTARSGPWHRLHRRARRGVRAPGAQRRRQDDDPRDPRGLPRQDHRQRQRARCGSRARGSTMAGAHRDGAPGCRRRALSQGRARCSNATRATTRSLVASTRCSSSSDSSRRPMRERRPSQGASNVASMSALGIIGAPELLFLDEPTTGFDPSARRGAWELVDRLRGEGTTIILTTHYMDEAQHLADRVVVINRRRDRRVRHPGDDRRSIRGRGAHPVRASGRRRRRVVADRGHP